MLNPGITDSCELPCGCWELNLGPLEKQSLLLIDEPSLQPKIFLWLVGFVLFFPRKCVSVIALAILEVTL